MARQHTKLEVGEQKKSGITLIVVVKHAYSIIKYKDIDLGIIS